MSGVKRQLEQDQDRENEAIYVAVEAGALQVCENHGTAFIDSGDKDEAEELAREMFLKGEVKSFDDVEDLVKAVNGAIDEHGAEECFACDYSD